MLPNIRAKCIGASDRPGMIIAAAYQFILLIQLIPTSVILR